LLVCNVRKFKISYHYPFTIIVGNKDKIKLFVFYVKYILLRLIDHFDARPGANKHSYLGMFADMNYRLVSHILENRNGN